MGVEPRGMRPAKISARSVALDLLQTVEVEGAYANLAMPALLSKSQLSIDDKALATELGYGTLRYQGLYDFFISELSSKPIESLDSVVRNILRLGLHQLINTRIPTHAAASESVELAKSTAGMGAGSFVNAILRNYLRQQESLWAKIDNFPNHKSLAIKYSHPEWIVGLLARQLGDDLSAQLEANNRQPSVYLAPWQENPVGLVNDGVAEFASDGATLRALIAPNRIKEIRERKIGVQDIGSQWLSRIWLATAQTQGQLKWLDLCAGPGGKAAYTFHSLQKMRPDDQFLANELSPIRAKLVAQVIPADVVQVGDGRDIATSGEHFDRILIDAPCSGLGALRRRPESRWRKDENQLGGLMKLQYELLSCAAKVVATGGLIGYATCSPFSGETEDQVARFLLANPNFQSVCLAEFAEKADVPGRVINERGHMQLWEYRDDSDDMFFAILRRIS